MSYYQNKCLEFKYNSKKLWGMINNIAGKLNDKTNIIESIKVDNMEYFDAFGITNRLCKYFAHVGENFSAKIPKSKKNINEYLSHITKTMPAYT